MDPYAVAAVPVIPSFPADDVGRLCETANG